MSGSVGVWGRREDEEVAVCGVGYDVCEWGVGCGMWAGWVCVGWVECDGCEGLCVVCVWCSCVWWVSVCDGLCGCVYVMVCGWCGCVLVGTREIARL